MTALSANTPAIFLLGATACGKTALSVRLAQAINAEIISVDSALVYRGMDVGTAKPTMTERAGVAHHLIDVCEPWQTYSAAEFCRDANTLISEIHGRGRRALLVGGTMLYFKALEEGLAELPGADVSVRNELTTMAEQLGWRALHDELFAVDPSSAARIHPNDPQRLQRALEVYRLTGIPLSEHHAATHSKLVVAPVKFALMPSDRSWLHQRIEHRLMQMLEQGLLEEVQQLQKDHRLHAELPSMRSVGYRQAWEHLNNIQRDTCVRSIDKPEAWVQKAVAATRQLAKRQLTWLRSMSNVTQIECDNLSQEKQLTIVRQTLMQQENVQHD